MREREREKREKRDKRETREKRERERERESSTLPKRKEREFFDVDPAKNSIAHTHTSDKKR